jgi:hypothetical protein
MKDGISEIPEGSSARINSDLRLMELADRNPSLGGRELLREIIERGPMPEENERRQAIDIRAALRIPSIDDPNYRTQSEQADWIGKDSKMMRDLYERGAQIRGRVLIVPAEEHELNEDRGTPFITTISYALEKIDDVEKAAEFHSLAQKSAATPQTIAPSSLSSEPFMERLPHPKRIVKRPCHEHSKKCAESRSRWRSLNRLRALSSHIKTNRATRAAELSIALLREPSD